MTVFRISLASLVILLCGQVATAHPGHGNPGGEESLLHYVLSPLHLLPVVLVSLILVGVLAMAHRYQRVAHAFSRERL